MNIVFSQVRGIAYYEFRMLWRERGQIVITLVLLLMVLIPSLVATNDLNGLTASDSFEFRGSIFNMTQIVVLIIWGPVGTTTGLLAPIFLADMIPKDSQIGVREVLDATPLSRSSYLVGKLLGGWLAMISTLLIVMLAAALLLWLRAGSISLSIYLEMWLTGAVSLVVINGGLGILIPATQNNRRRAILFMIIFLVVVAALGGLDLTQDFLSPLRGPIITYYMDVGSSNARRLFLLTIGAGLLQLVAVTVGVWAWLRFRDGQR